jgi:hypothetical protein
MQTAISVQCGTYLGTYCKHYGDISNLGDPFWEAGVKNN